MALLSVIENIPFLFYLITVLSLIETTIVAAWDIFCVQVLIFSDLFQQTSPKMIA
ncbi:hypothetical protein LYNGBM3L_74350 [Moorena producens 3L]|uniref:Uncharacterized protein n=1 Tax=Moorena producens 3L TaxID=489825 RepID=F4Y474_9CYAN|nr:hypothetical protein LYNGBM3L_74350 [Moorena producens 3L]